MTNLPRSKVKETRVIGLDYGMKRIGIAVSDPSKMIASPLATFFCEKKLEDTVAKILEEIKQHEMLHRYRTEEIVIGLPLMLSGKKGLLADEVFLFVDLLKNQSEIPVVTWDERLTTMQAERSLNETCFSRKKRSQKVDTVAATIILQNYLDYKSTRST